MKYLRPSLVLFVVAFAAYGLLIPRLGFYWDDLPILWIRYQLGPEALTKYFSTNRPVWGMLYQITTGILPPVPIYWQIFALIWRWLGAVTVYGIAFKLWRDHARLALGVALLFLVYPGFNQHPTAFLYSHFYIVLFFLLFSFLCTLQALDSARHAWAWTMAGIFFAALNLWMMEYFYVLELARVLIIFAALRHISLPWRERLMRTLKLWLPYLAVFMLAVFSRLFIFNNQIYGMSLTGQVKSAPLETLIALLQTIRLTLRLVLKNAWLRTVDFSDVVFFDSIAVSYYGVIIFVVLFSLAGFFLMPREADQTIRSKASGMLWMIGLGIFAMLLAGGPFWLINFVPSLDWPASRFALPFAFGVSLMLGGVIGLIPWEKLQIALLVVFISLAVGRQYLNSQNYAQDWMVQKELFWQMTWRAPGIEPNTLVLLNEGALKYYADNSLGAALNWIYAPDTDGERFEYVLFYPKTRLRNGLPKLEPGLPIHYDYLAAQFDGNTSQTIAVYYAPPQCLRILDPEIERLNRLIPEQSLMRFSANISNPGLIVNEPRAKMLAVYGPEPAHDFCYYFQKADLARQYKDWDAVVLNGEAALSSIDHPYEPAEQLVFIEGYAHVGEWERAVELSKTAYEASPDVMGRMLCELWRRIEAETADGSNRSAALDKIQNIIACDL